MFMFLAPVFGGLDCRSNQAKRYRNIRRSFGSRLAPAMLCYQSPVLCCTALFSNQHTAFFSRGAYPALLVFAAPYIRWFELSPSHCFARIPAGGSHNSSGHMGPGGRHSHERGPRGGGRGGRGPPAPGPNQQPAEETNQQPAAH